MSVLWCLVHDTTGDVKLDHSIEIAGWGVTNEGVKYCEWLIPLPPLSRSPSALLDKLHRGPDNARGTAAGIGRNSWGTYWGERGWFRLVRGINNLGVEANCDWAVWDGVVPSQFRKGGH